MNKVMYFKIPAVDLEKSGAFYKTVFGWQLSDDVQMPDSMYRMATTTESDEMQVPKTRSAINGALMNPNEAIKAPAIVIDVPSLDECLAAVQKAGGKVVKEKIEVPGIGAYAYVADVEGNVMGVWQNLSDTDI